MRKYETLEIWFMSRKSQVCVLGVYNLSSKFLLQLFVCKLVKFWRLNGLNPGLNASCWPVSLASGGLWLVKRFLEL